MTATYIGLVMKPGSEACNLYTLVIIPRLTAVDVGISVLLHIGWEGALDVSERRRLDGQYLYGAG